MDETSNDQAQWAQPPLSGTMDLDTPQNATITFLVHCHVESKNAPYLTTWELPPFRSPVEITLPESQYIGDVQTFLREQLVDALRQINRGFEYYCSDAILLARSVRRVDGQPGRGYVPELVMMSSYFGGDVRHLYELLGGPNLWLILYRGTASPHLQRMQGYGADA